MLYKKGRYIGKFNVFERALFQALWLINKDEFRVNLRPISKVGSNYFSTGYEKSEVFSELCLSHYRFSDTHWFVIWLWNRAA